MSASSDKPGMYAASGSTAASSSGATLPPDERLAEPETRYEVFDGELCYVSPADENHAHSHSGLDYLLNAHVADGYLVAVDMLTRTSKTSDLAPDASVYPAARDPETGGRQLEELAFEIASTQSRASATRRARGLSGRGVRRIFLLWVARDQVLEWDLAADSWRVLAPSDSIEDRCLVRPLPVAALLSAAARDEEVAKALLAKRNPVLEDALAQSRAEGRAEGEAKGRAEGEAKGRAEGQAKGTARAVLKVLEARGLVIPPHVRARILSSDDPEQLDRWLARAIAAESAEDLLGDDGS